MTETREPRLLTAQDFSPGDLGELKWAPRSELVVLSEDQTTVMWSPDIAHSGVAPPIWIPIPSKAHLHSGSFQLDFVVEEMAEAQIGVGFMLCWDIGPDWGFYGYLGSSSSAWAYDPSTGDVVRNTRSIEGGLPTFPDRHQGTVRLHLDLPADGDCSACFEVDGTRSSRVEFPPGSVVMPAACLLAKTQKVRLQWA